MNDLQLACSPVTVALFDPHQAVNNLLAQGLGTALGPTTFFFEAFRPVAFKTGFDLQPVFVLMPYSQHSSLKFALLFARKANWVFWFTMGSVCCHAMFEAYPPCRQTVTHILNQRVLNVV